MESLLKQIQENNEWCVDELSDIVNFKWLNDMKNLVAVGAWNHFRNLFTHQEQVYLKEYKRNSIYVIHNSQIIVKFWTGLLNKVMYSKYFNKLFIFIDDFSLTLRGLILAMDLNETLNIPCCLQEKGLGKIIKFTRVPWHNIQLLRCNKKQAESYANWYGKTDFQDFGFTSFNKDMRLWAIYSESGIFGKKIGLFCPVTLNHLQEIPIYSFSDSLKGFMDWKMNCLHIYSIVSGHTLSYSQEAGLKIIKKMSTSIRIPYNIIISNGLSILLDWRYMIIWNRYTLQEISRVQVSYYKPNWLSISIYDQMRFPDKCRKLTQILKEACKIWNLGDTSARRHWPVIDLNNNKDFHR